MEKEKVLPATAVPEAPQSAAPQSAALPAGLVPLDLPAGAAGRITALARVEDRLHVAVDTAAGARLLCRDLAEGTWRETGTLAGESVTGFAVFAAEGSPARLCAATRGPGGARLLAEGAEGAMTPLWAGSKDGTGGLLAPVVWQGWLVTAGLPAGGAADDGLAGRVLARRAPGAEGWTALSAPGLGDAENTGISALAVHGGRLYAATVNHRIGFQLWSLGAPGEDWVQHLREGATRFAMNPAVGCMVSRDDALWIGTAMPVAPDVPGIEWPPAEVIVLYDDGEWELVAGEPRFTPQGLRTPLSLYGPGFDDPAATVVGAMAVQGGEIVLGTGPAAWLWSSADEETWTEADLGAEEEGVAALGGVTAMAAGGDGLWIAAGGRLYRRDSTVHG